MSYKNILNQSNKNEAENGQTNSIITVVRDYHHTLGPDGKISKNLWQKVTNFLSAAMFWFGFGFNVIPILPGTKKPAVKWTPWLTNLTPQKIHAQWTAFPDHELGCIVGDDLIVLDSDTPESLSALSDLEYYNCVLPMLVIETTKGEHHYYRRAPGTIAKSGSHDSDKFPDRIDIKTGRALAILPISTGKSIRILDAENKDELPAVSQEFIDAIYKHNGRPLLSRETSLPREKTDRTHLYSLVLTLKSIDSDCGYDDWIRVGMAIFHETEGSDFGLRMFDDWSSQGKKYKGLREIKTKWRSFRLDIENPVTVGTLLRMAFEAEEFEPYE